MSNIQVGLLQATHNPAAHVGIALSIENQLPDDEIPQSVSEMLCSTMMESSHFKHVVYNFLVENASASVLDRLGFDRKTKQLMWTSSALGLQNFLQEHLHGSDPELKDFAFQVLSLAQDHFPEYFNNVH